MHKLIMEKITVSEALKQGYALCGYDKLEYQQLMKISELQPCDFEPHNGGVLLVADTKSNSVTISSEEVVDWLTDRYFDTDGNPDDDTHDMELRIKEKEELINNFVSEINKVYAEKEWFYLCHKIQLVPDLI